MITSFNNSYTAVSYHSSQQYDVHLNVLTEAEDDRPPYINEGE